MARSLARQIIRTVFAGLAGVALVATAPCAFADYPNRAIHIVVPFPAGGATDVAARTIAHQMSLSLGQSVVVDNRPGGDGLIAGDVVAKAPADGYTLLMGTATGMIYAPLARRQVPYDPASDLTPIGRICEAAFFLYVHDSVPARSLQELIALTRKHPGELNHGSATAAGILASLQFEKSTSIRWVDVPYRGEAPMFQDLLGGRLQVSFASGGGLGHAKSGRLRVLATTLTSRSRLMPDVPTLEEAGIPRVSVVPWAALFGPPGMPAEVTERLSRELRSTLSRGEVREQLEALAFQPTPSTPAELAAYVKDQLGVWKQAMDAAGIKPQ
jgi:tripartite-type tricarboxylate transporter receptor subunit TctC